VDDEREVDVESARPLDALAARSGMKRPDGADVGAIEQVVLNTHDGVVGVVRPASLRVEEAELSTARPARGSAPLRRSARPHHSVSSPIRRE